MDTFDWQIIIALKEKMSINKAATSLYMSQPSLTYRLNQMEKEMDRQLFIRTKKGVHFTSAGERLYSYAHKMLREYSDMTYTIRSEPDKIIGILRLGASTAFSHNQLPELLKEFHDEYPCIDLSLTTGLSDKLMKQLCAEEIDIGIIRGDHHWDELSFTLQNEPLFVVSAKPIDMQNLPNIPGIKYHTDCTMQAQESKWWQENFSSPPKYLISVDSALTCLKLISAGLGWGILPDIRLNQIDNKFCIYPLQDSNGVNYNRCTHLFYGFAAENNDASFAFVNFIKKKYDVSLPKD